MTFKQTGTDPTYVDLLDIMRLRSGLQEECFQMEVKLDFFLQYDKEFICEATFYEELSAWRKPLTGFIGVRRVLPNGRRRDLPELRDWTLKIDPSEAGDIMELRETLGRKFARQ